MTQEDIKEINDKCPSDQGIFFQPTMIPIDIKEHVIYRRFCTEGMSGGNCWGDRARHTYFDDEKEGFIALDLALEKLKPNITYLQYKKIEKMIHTNEETWGEYYGNSTDWKVEYIILSELEEFLDNC